MADAGPACLRQRTWPGGNPLSGPLHRVPFASSPVGRAPVSPSLAYHARNPWPVVVDCSLLRTFDGEGNFFVPLASPSPADGQQQEEEHGVPGEPSRCISNDRNGRCRSCEEGERHEG